MRCQIEGCTNEAAHVVDAESGAAYRLCSPHVPTRITAIVGAPTSVSLSVPSASITMLGGFGKNTSTTQ